MPFNITKTEYKKTFSKVQFLYLEPGQHVIRFLDITDNAREVYTHYISNSRITVECLGDECPICQTNRKIILEHPDGFREVPGFISRSPRYMINVLDRTHVKVCPKCQAENKRNPNGVFPAKCVKCDAFITAEPEVPSNKVKVLSLSKTTATQISDFEATVRDSEGNVIPVTKYDYMLIVPSTGKKIPAPAPMAHQNDVVEVNPESLYDLNSATIKLTPDEIVNVLKGVSLKDIFASRKANTPALSTEEAGEVDEKSIQAKIDELL